MIAERSGSASDAERSTANGSESDCALCVGSNKTRRHRSAPTARRSTSLTPIKSPTKKNGYGTSKPNAYAKKDSVCHLSRTQLSASMSVCIAVACVPFDGLAMTSSTVPDVMSRGLAGSFSGHINVSMAAVSSPLGWRLLQWSRLKECFERSRSVKGRGGSPPRVLRDRPV